jgi:hypothetical protein
VESYSFKPYRLSVFDKQQGRKRENFPRGTASVSFTFLEQEYEDFRSFWYSDLSNGRRWFELSLPCSNGMKTHVVRFAGEYKADSAGFGMTVIRAELEVFNSLTYVDETLPPAPVDPLWAQVAFASHLTSLPPVDTTSGNQTPSTITASLATGANPFGGNALRFAGTETIDYAANTRNIKGDQTFTIELWVKPVSTFGFFNIVYDGRSSSANDGPIIWVTSNAEIRAWAPGFNNGDHVLSIAINQWSFVRLVIRPTTSDFSVNTTQDSTKAKSNPMLSSSQFRLGQTVEGGNFFRGDLFDIRVTHAERQLSIPTEPFPQS